MQNRAQLVELIGQSKIFLDALEHASEVAHVDRPVLVIGERGSGKELFASRIHFLSDRWDGPLIKVNCAAMNEELLESELFGHEPGAFTGAARKHTGRFERGEGGTLFLDEIASSSMRVQEKLLRVIEYGEYERVGGEKTLNADVRIVAAANVDLRARARQGRFRADLLDRLAFDVVAAPPLRERREDIPTLAAHFAAAMGTELGAPFPGFSPKAHATLQSHDWPGNVRELKNAAERAVFRWSYSQETTLIEAIVIDPFEALAMPEEPMAVKSVTPKTEEPPPASFDDEVMDLRAQLDGIEKQIVISALRRHGGNQKQAAGALSLTYDQIRGVIRKHEIDARNLGAA